MWHEINNEDELQFFKKNIARGFHDCCLKELHYESGAYVSDDLSMFPINSKRTLKVIFQCQFEENSVIELEFSELSFAKLYPVEPEYTCEILSANLLLHNGNFYWCDEDCVSTEELDEYKGTVICATQLRWRTLENALGEGTIL